jgi:5'-nucleotidase
MRILVTNDDGVAHPGLAALAGALGGLAEVVALAPERNWSASGHVKTMHKPLRLEATQLADGRPAVACTGAPSDCVAMALLGAVPGPIDLVVAGINPNANLGHDITYSGTVTAAMEAAIGGVPGIAVSLDGQGVRDYEPAAAWALKVARAVLAHGLPPGLLLNVNVPRGPIRGVRVTRQGLRVYRDELVERRDPRGRPYYWFGGAEPIGLAEPGTDVAALADGYVSITPLQLDLTAREALSGLAAWTELAAVF